MSMKAKAVRGWRLFAVFALAPVANVPDSARPGGLGVFASLTRTPG